MISYGRVGIAMGGGTLCLMLWLTSACSKKQPQQTAQPAATPTPTPFIPRKVYDTARLFNGIKLKSSIETTPTDFTSLHLGREPDSYTLQLELRLQLPSPATTSTDLLAATPELAGLLPALDQLLTNAKASPDFATLYSYKEKNLRANLTTLQRLLPIDTLYDCQTILKLQNPRTLRSVILVQALMNVNADGSDGDRNLAVDNHSAFYQPQTNYRWPKATAHTNPCLHDTEQKLASISEKLNSESGNSLSPAERSRLLNLESEEKATLEELKHLSFLVGTADPFIVLPSFMFKGSEGHPNIGDYAIVIVGNTVYPAILGDKGPNYKMGEASLRICKEVDKKSTADSRPIDRPTVVYLIFPGTAENPFSTPDYGHWSDRCHALWKEIGGSDFAKWQVWDSLEKPWPTPTPLPTPSPSIFPSPSPDTNSVPVPLNSPSPLSWNTSGMNPAPMATPTVMNPVSTSPPTPQ
ncbi:MAG: glycoside hydrolase family 75 protein [bacterium]